MINNKDEILKRREYVRSLSAFIEPISYLESIEYAREPLGNGDFIKISEVTGDSIFLDITDLSRAEIARDIAKCVLMGEIDDSIAVPVSLIAGREARLNVAELFR